MSNTTLKLPDGSFSHSDLAIANGKTNQQVWAEYSRLRKEGIIVSAGVRSTGKGKPTSLWKVQDGIVVPVITLPAIQSASRVNRVVKPVVVTEPTEASIALVVEAKLASVKPAKAPEPEPVAVVEVVEPVVKTVKNLTGQVTTTDYECPFCKTKLLAVDVETGVKVWCPVNNWKVCSCSENPYGVSNNIKNAVEILNDKFFKHRPTKA